MKAFRLVTGTVVAAALASALMAAPAEAQTRRKGISPGAAAAIGILGVAAGAAIAGAASQPVYAAPRPVYVPPPAPVYVEPEPVYVPRPRVVAEERCYTERTREWVSGYGWQTVKRTICD
jgi:hypothetical protein